MYQWNLKNYTNELIYKTETERKGICKPRREAWNSSILHSSQAEPMLPTP